MTVNEIIKGLKELEYTTLSQNELNALLHALNNAITKTDIEKDARMLFKLNETER